MASYKPVGIDEDGLLPPRARTALQTRYHAEDSTNLVDDPYCLGNIEDELGWRVAGSGWILGPSQDGTRRSLQMTGETLGAPYTRVTNNNISPVVPGERIDVSFFGRNTSDGEIWMQLQVFDSNRANPAFWGSVVVPINTTEWTEFTQSITVPSDKYYVRITFQTRNISTGFAEITQTSVTKRIDAGQVVGIEDAVQTYLESEGYTPFDSTPPSVENWPSTPDSGTSNAISSPYAIADVDRTVNLTGNGSPVDINWQGFGVSMHASMQSVFLNPKFTRLRKEIMRILYSKGWGTGWSGHRGIGLDVARVAIGHSNGNPTVDRPQDWERLSTFKPEPGGTLLWERDYGQAEAVRYAHAYNPGLKVLASCWAPPEWMRENKTMNPAYLPHYGTYLVEYAKQHDGSDWDNGRFKLDYLSIFNEPSVGDTDFSITDEMYKDALIAVGSKFQVENVTHVQLIGPEQAGLGRTRETVDFLYPESGQNPTGWSRVGAIATHFYGSQTRAMRWDMDNWETIKPADTSKPIYQTEITQYEGDYEDAMDLAENIHWWISGVRASMFNYWVALNWPSRNDMVGKVSLMGSSDSGMYNPSPKLSVMGQFSRFIDPGYKLMQVGGSDSPSNALANGDPFLVTAMLCRDGNHTRTVVINRKSSNRILRIWGVRGNIVQVWQTDNEWKKMSPMVKYFVEENTNGDKYVIVNSPANSVITVSDVGTCTA